MKRLFTMVAMCVLAGAWLAAAEEPAPAGKVLMIENGQALCCTCAADCKCALADGGKTCNCGKPVTSVSVVGKFVCAACRVVSDKEGKCAKCGEALKKVEAPAKAK